MSPVGDRERRTARGRDVSHPADDPVPFQGQAVPIAQCNNVYIFPALGLGAVASQARRITDRMLRVAALTLAKESPTVRDPTAPLLPPVSELRNVAIEIAVEVGLEAQRTRLAPPSTADELREKVRATQWTPMYPVYATG